MLVSVCGNQLRAACRLCSSPLSLPTCFLLTGIAFQKNGWMDHNIYGLYWQHFKKNILKIARSTLADNLDHNSDEWRQTPWVAVVLDSHNTHLTNLVVLEEAYHQRVLFFNFPSHCTHVLQPLDTGLFRALKNEFRNSITEHSAAHIANGVPLGFRLLIKAINDARHVAFQPQSIKNGKRKVRTFGDLLCCMLPYRFQLPTCTLSYNTQLVYIFSVRSVSSHKRVARVARLCAEA